MYAIIRADLEMTPGKMAAQAGHAFLDTYIIAETQDPDRVNAYIGPGHGTKVVLAASDEMELYHLRDQASDAELPWALITDSGHISPPHFDGSPVLTALGIGPVTRDEIHAITKHLPLIR